MAQIQINNRPEADPNLARQIRESLNSYPRNQWARVLKQWAEPSVDPHKVWDNCETDAEVAARMRWAAAQVRLMLEMEDLPDDPKTSSNG